MREQNIAFYYACDQKWRGSRIQTCSDCGTEFSYEMERVPEGYGFSETKAREKFFNALNRSLEKDVDLVPCPVCGRFQADMIAQKRKITKATVVFFLILWLVVSVAIGWFAGYESSFWFYTTRYVFAGIVALLLLFSFCMNCVTRQSTSGSSFARNNNKEATIITPGTDDASLTNRKTPSVNIFTTSIVLFIFAIVFALVFLVVPVNNNLRNFQIVWGTTAFLSFASFVLALLSNTSHCKKLENLAGAKAIDHLVFININEEGEEEIDPQ